MFTTLKNQNTHSERFNILKYVDSETKANGKKKRIFDPSELDSILARAADEVYAGAVDSSPCPRSISETDPVLCSLLLSVSTLACSKKLVDRLETCIGTCRDEKNFPDGAEYLAFAVSHVSAGNFDQVRLARLFSNFRDAAFHVPSVFANRGPRLGEGELLFCSEAESLLLDIVFGVESEFQTERRNDILRKTLETSHKDGETRLSRTGGERIRDAVLADAEPSPECFKTMATLVRHLPPGVSWGPVASAFGRLLKDVRNLEHALDAMRGFANAACDRMKRWVFGFSDAMACAEMFMDISRFVRGGAAGAGTPGDVPETGDAGSFARIFDRIKEAGDPGHAARRHLEDILPGAMRRMNIHPGDSVSNIFVWEQVFQPEEARRAFATKIPIDGESMRRFVETLAFTGRRFLEKMDVNETKDSLSLLSVFLNGLDEENREGVETAARLSGSFFFAGLLEHLEKRGKAKDAEMLREKMRRTAVLAAAMEDEEPGGEVCL